MSEIIKLPTKVVVDSEWRDDIDTSDLGFELVGRNEEGEKAYKNNNAVLVNKSEVKNATTDYKNRKIGRVAIFSAHDRLAA